MIYRIRKMKVAEGVIMDLKRRDWLEWDVNYEQYP